MPYRFAIIGCGQIAQRHAAEIAAVGTLVAVCDVIIERASVLAAKYDAIAYSSIDQLLKETDVDIVCVCTPNGLHAAHSISALNAGSHVLCEKPMAIAVADGKNMIDAATKNNRKLYVVKQNRFNPPVAAVRKLFEEGKLGRIHSFQLNCFWNRPPAYYNNNWRGTANLDGGTLYTQFSHFIDLLYWFMGDVAEAHGVRSNVLHKNIIEFEDNGSAILQMASGASGIVQYSINSYGRNMEGSLTLFGEKGTVKIGGQYLNQLEYFNVKDAQLPTLIPGNSSNNYSHYEGSMSNHRRVYEELIKALSQPMHEMVEATEALKTIEIVEKIYANSPMTGTQNNL
ncbi:MAG: Gfo/Idh/MocA family oxidoreductase [Chitinophagaceae bacterium]|nr:Gfo/Idh/MocA family oxidoreductase [Chitinophagaceae bacterium]